MTSYETIYVLKTDLEGSGAKKIHQRLEEVIKRGGGEMKDQKDLGPKGLAYMIERQSRGHFFQLDFKGDGKIISEIEKNLRLSEGVLRFLTVRVDEPKKEVTHDE